MHPGLYEIAADPRYGAASCFKPTRERPPLNMQRKLALRIQMLRSSHAS
jgi:hypothetical protein